jgi:hypothetical protein
VLYRLPEVTKSERVLVLEGEKCCEAARAIGLVATCNPGGAGKWRPEYAQFLRGKCVSVICDADASGTGQRHGRDAARSLVGVAASVRLIEALPGVPDKGDLVDYLAAGGTRESLLELIRATPELTSADQADSAASQPVAVAQTETPPRFAADDRPAITLRAGRLPWIVDEASQVLAARSEALRIFQRGIDIVRIVSLPAERKTRWGQTILKRQAGTLLLEPLHPAALSDIFGRIVRWQRCNKSGKARDVDCPPQIATTYRSRTGAWGLPVLSGIIAAPILRPDGTVLHRAGYDAATGLFLTEDWPAVNSNPTRDDARNALVQIVETFIEFPFVTEAGRNVFIAAILTALLRRLLASAPLFGFSAPSQRTGKSLLAECVAILATGGEAPAMTVSENREEIRKAVLAVLQEGHAIVNLDNVEHPLKSPDLSRAITQPLYQDRLLGESRTATAPTNVLWTSTGNNLTFRGDLAVRTLLCQLDAVMERPEERTFRIKDLKGYVAQHRQELVTAALTILRAYFAAGRPDQQIKTWGGFEEWSDAVRAPLVWLGLADPYESREQIIEDDPEREQAVTLLPAWRAVFGNDYVRLSVVLRHAQENVDFKDALAPVAKNRNGELDSRVLSHWCRKQERRIVAGLLLVKGESFEGHVTWGVVMANQ